MSNLKVIGSKMEPFSYKDDCEYICVVMHFNGGLNFIASKDYDLTNTNCK